MATSVATVFVQGFIRERRERRAWRRMERYANIGRHPSSWRDR